MKSVTLLDLIEIYNLKNGNDLDNIGSIFADIELDSRLDKNVLIGCILDECGAMRTMYDTTSTFKYFSDNFFKKYKWNIEKLVNTLEAEYDPLINKNLEWTETTDISQDLLTEEGREEGRTKNNTGTQTTNDTGTQTTEDTGTQTTENTGTQTTKDTGTQTTNETGTQTTNETGTQTNVLDEDQVNTVSAMNSSTYEPDNMRETDSTNTRTDNLQNQRTDNLQNQRTDNLESERTDNLESQRTDNLQSERTDNLQSLRTDNLTETIESSVDRNKNENLTWDETDKHVEKGLINISHQELLEKERKIAQFSIYNWITKKYAKELFLLVY